jgi:hypothetical protein
LIRELSQKNKGRARRRRRGHFKVVTGKLGAGRMEARGRG